MDDIYGNLDNYEEENVIDELKSENKELKFKLEEYASTLSNLQKDFDKLSSEYKKLELNYSSLLKTAKAEIERKTRIITNLNLEKDQIVLNALQKRGRIPPNQYKKILNKENSQQTVHHIAKGADSKKLNDDVNVQNSTDKSGPSILSNERKKTPDKITSSSVPTLKVSSDVKEKATKAKPAEDPNQYRDKYKSDTKDVKENPKNDITTEKIKNKVSKITQRRKSMPLMNHGDFKFSSDEEQEDKTYNIQEHQFRRKSPLREVIDRRYDRDRNHKYFSKEPPYYATEMTREDKFARHRDLKDNHYKSSSRYNDNDWHRRPDTRNRYDTRSKSRLNTDRNWCNTRREYSNDQSHRTDYGRHRVTVSSPPEKHNSLRRSRDEDRHRFQTEEAYGYKHKIHDVIDEPSHKRLRTESPKRQPDEYIMLQHDGHVAFQAAPASFIPYSSLQSPDYSAMDPHPVQKVREIKSTATTKLDDPRFKSNKYVHNMYKDKVVLSTVAGRNIKLKRIDEDIWGVDKEIQKMPTPLREKPQISEDFLSQIYMGINDPISNLSLESGEVDCKDIDDLTYTNLGNTDKKLNTIKTMAGGINTLDIKYDELEFNKLQSHNQSKVTKTHTDTSDNVQRKLKIPSLGKPKSKPLDDITGNAKNEDKRDNAIGQCHKKYSQEEKREADKNKEVEVEINPSKFSSNNRRSSKSKAKDQLPDLRRDEYQEMPIISVRDTVEGDLELSDETSDCADYVDQTRDSNEKSGGCTREPVIVRIPKKKLLHGSDITSEQQGVFQYEIEKLCKNKNANILKLDTDAQPKELIIQKELNLNKDNRHTKEDIQTKLCDLFGDSSSLITPDDLGFVEQPAVKPIPIKPLYSPLFDNTQDALDLNVEEMEKVRTRTSKVNIDKAGANNNQQDVKQDKKHKSRSSKTNGERKKKQKHIVENSSRIEHNRENRKEVLNAEPNNEPNVVKTVIISSGVQNSCETKDPMSDRGQEILRNTLTLPNLKALATSTPHKTWLNRETEPSLPVPECSSTSNMSTNSSSVKGNTEDNISKTSQNDLDVPEFRIVVKRRRKARAPN